MIKLMILQLPKNGKEGGEMKVKCDYCQQLVEETEKSCPFCGAVMPTVNRTASEQPKTIEELKAWYTARNLPPENVTRFFIGKDVKEARAFGIYKDVTGDFVVYKNKADGSRAVRYKGADEEYAVNEIYQKLKAEIANQKSHNTSSQTRSYTPPRKKKNSGFGSLIGVLMFFMFRPLGITLLVIIIAIIRAIFDTSPSDGYYRYQGNDYYYQDDSWYYYNTDSDSWDYYSNSFLDDIINDDNDSEYRVYDHDGSDFEDSYWYDDDDDYSYSWDSGSSWDYDSSWDSDSSWDWDSGSSWDSWDSGNSWNSNW